MSAKSEARRIRRVRAIRARSWAWVQELRQRTTEAAGGRSWDDVERWWGYKQKEQWAAECDRQTVAAGATDPDSTPPGWPTRQPAPRNEELCELFRPHPRHVVWHEHPAHSGQETT